MILIEAGSKHLERGAFLNVSQLFAKLNEFIKVLMRTLN